MAPRSQGHTGSPSPWPGLTQVCLLPPTSSESRPHAHKLRAEPLQLPGFEVTYERDAPSMRRQARPAAAPPLCPPVPPTPPPSPGVAASAAACASGWRGLVVSPPTWAEG